MVAMTTANMTDLPRWASIQQAADHFGVSAKSIRRWIAEGHVKAVRLRGKLIRVDRDSLLALVKPIGGL